MSADPPRGPPRALQQNTSAKRNPVSGLHLPRPSQNATAWSEVPVDVPDSPDIPLSSLPIPKTAVGPAPGTSYSAPFQFRQSHSHPLRPALAPSQAQSAPPPTRNTRSAVHDGVPIPSFPTGTAQSFVDQGYPFATASNYFDAVHVGPATDQNAPSSHTQPTLPRFVAHDEPSLGRLKQTFIRGEDDTSMYLNFVDLERLCKNQGAGVDALLVEMINEYLVKKEMYRAAYGLQMDALQQPYTEMLSDQESIKAKVAGRAPRWPDSPTGPLFKWFSQFCHEKLFPKVEAHVEWRREDAQSQRAHNLHDATNRQPPRSAGTAGSLGSVDIAPYGRATEVKTAQTVQNETYTGFVEVEQSSSRSRTNSLTSELDRMDLAKDRVFSDDNLNHETFSDAFRARFEDPPPFKRRRRETVASETGDAGYSAVSGGNPRGRPPNRPRSQTNSASEEHHLFILPGVKEPYAGSILGSVPTVSSATFGAAPAPSLARRQTLPSVTGKDKPRPKRSITVRKRISDQTRSVKDAPSSSGPSSGRRPSTKREPKGKGRAREETAEAPIIDPAIHGYYHPPDTAGRWPGFNAEDFYKPISETDIIRLAASAPPLPPLSQSQQEHIHGASSPDVGLERQAGDHEMVEDETTPKWNEYLGTSAYDPASHSGQSSSAGMLSSSAVGWLAPDLQPELLSVYGLAASIDAQQLDDSGDVVAHIQTEGPSTFEPNMGYMLGEGLTPLLESAFPPDFDWQDAMMQQAVFDSEDTTGHHEQSLFTPPDNSD